MNEHPRVTFGRHGRHDAVPPSPKAQEPRAPRRTPSASPVLRTLGVGLVFVLLGVVAPQGVSAPAPKPSGASEHAAMWPPPLDAEVKLKDVSNGCGGGTASPDPRWGGHVASR